MKSLYTIILLALGLSASSQDTVTVQTITYDSTARDYVFQFPEDDGTTYEKIIMKYSMRCKDALVSTPTDRNKGCGEWDYSCNTYIRDSSYTDSVKATHPSNIISGFSGTTFNYNVNPSYSYYEYILKNSSITINNEDTFSIGNGSVNLAHPFKGSSRTSKTQYMWKASELTSAGVSAGNINGLFVDVSTAGSESQFLKIKLKQTTDTALNSSTPHMTGFSTVFYNHLTLSTGMNDIRFHTGFNWNGSSNIIVELSFTNSTSGSDNILNGHDAGFTSSIISSDFDNYFEFTGGEYFDIGNSGFSTISDELTISFWAFGNENNLPANTSAFEGTNNASQRQVNAHLPWSNSRVYWDCGSDGSYDRIDKAAAASALMGQWNHWAFTKNATSGDMEIYLNGNLWHSGTGKNKLIDLKNLVLGTNISKTNHYFGKIDDYQIWNTALSSTDINDWMFRKLDNSHPQYSSLVATYELNEGVGSTANDGSSFNESALIVGNPNWKFYRGSDLFKGFVSSSNRPNVAFVQGSYTISNTDSAIIDTVQNNATQVVYYQTVGSDVEPYDTAYVWNGNYEYLYAEDGSKLDSFAFANPSSLSITDLNYFAKYPMDFEIMSFVTPYGIYLDLGVEGKTWTFDVSDFEPILHGKKKLFFTGGVYQEELDIKFEFIKGTPPRDVVDIQQIWRVQSRNYNQINADDYFQPVSLRLDTGASDFKIRTAITGHGQEGEFIPRLHYINIDGGSNENEWEVWKECADNPVYPQGGTWIFDRAGWCPGAATDVEDLYLEANAGDVVSIDYGLVNSAGGDSRYFVNSQLVSYGTPNFNLDASIVDVIRPSKKIEYDRINPACHEPMILIQNTGGDTLTSLEIEYGVQGGTAETFTWTGSLAFMEVDTVVLPVTSTKFWYSPNQSNLFDVTISNANGGTDEYANNNFYSSSFDQVREFLSPVEVYLYTNLKSNENSYALTNLDGDTLLSATPSDLSSYTEYIDELSLPVGCYSFEFRDDMVGQYGQNGLEFWFYSNFGMGIFTIGDSVEYEYFDPDFGAYVKYDFSIGEIYASDVPEGVDYQLFRLYPNPTNGVLNVELHGFENSVTQLTIFNSVGQAVLNETEQLTNRATLSYDISSLANGIYYLKIESGNQIKTRKFIKN